MATVVVRQHLTQALQCSFIRPVLYGKFNLAVQVTLTEFSVLLRTGVA